MEWNAKIKKCCLYVAKQWRQPVRVWVIRRNVGFFPHWLSKETLLLQNFGEVSSQKRGLAFICIQYKFEVHYVVVFLVSRKFLSHPFVLRNLPQGILAGVTLELILTSISNLRKLHIYSQYLLLFLRHFEWNSWTWSFWRPPIQLFASWDITVARWYVYTSIYA